MRWSLALLAGVSFVKSQSLGNAVVENRCSYDLYLWSIPGYDDNSYHPNPPSVMIPKRTFHSEQFQVPACSNACGMSLKLSTEPVLRNPIVQFEYSITDNHLSYDISFVDCVAPDLTWNNCLAHELGIKLFSTSTASGCDPFDCDGDPQGRQLCKSAAYYQPVPNGNTIPEGEGDGWQPVKYCSGGQSSGDLVFVACKGNPALPGSRPEPSSTPTNRRAS
ncbi:hypothetical protein K432DRAFT_389543 [Lepidopterella palustris CBS 459.81]|uniref:Uncharacterized protein n=1 Tax=Lepidopterella palustris CBS 459.81 TaxID=1314670 RepID=A0A8E2EIC8_9PEZI|nr:hypothetical protein K432DRAFT_389543 [Lepidopterella palustris CBS 459.81]